MIVTKTARTRPEEEREAQRRSLARPLIRKRRRLRLTVRLRSTGR
jgi:hypothetical protein